MTSKESKVRKRASKESNMTNNSSKESVSEDNRYRWFTGTISNVLGIYDTKYAVDLIDEHPEQLKAFFDDAVTKNADIDKQIIFLWRTYYDKLVEETVTVLEEGQYDILH